MDKKIKVAFFGNTCNNYYQLIKLLKYEDEFELHLFIDKNSDPQQLPESDDQSLKDNYPDWIHFGNYINTKNILFPWLSPLVQELKGFDLFVVSHFGPVFAQFAGVPYIFFTAGADLTVHPFAISYINLYYHTPKQKIGSLFLSYWQKKGILKSYQIWSQPFFPFINALDKLGVKKESISKDFTPLVINIQKKLKNSDKFLSEAKELNKKFDFIVFYPSRIMVNRNKKMVNSGNWKANDIFIKAYYHFINQNQKINTSLVLIDRPASVDKDILLQLIKELEIEDYITWLKPKNGFGFTRNELNDLYSISDAVVDDFGVGWFGSIVVEALSLGINVISYVDDNVMKKMYPWHPILSSKIPKEIAKLLFKLYSDKRFKETNAARGPKWIEQFHKGENVKQLYKRKLLEVFNSYHKKR
jgi:hypothetical protein